MARYKDITGMVYGRLTVKEYTGNKTKAGSYVWLCLCVCGGSTLVSSGNLHAGHVTSCGCHRTEVNKSMLKAYNEKLGNASGIDSDIKRAYYLYKRSAVTRNYTFELSKSDFMRIASKPCFYCGKNQSITLGDYKYNGIDRKDNTRGYVLENCVPCCTRCNRAKMVMSHTEYIELCRSVTEYQNILHPE